MRPATIFEIGSGSGASAVWFADMCTIMDIDCAIVSLDRRRPSVTRQGVIFTEGECGDIARAIPAETVAHARKPILLIEDAHEHVADVLGHFAAHMRTGDRIVVEDSASKQNVLQQFTASSGMFLVDTLYTDFFGTNATSAMNSFFVHS
jgi:cephalosporin hydroxylase